ncbi:MAG: rhamnan synthesis F family protein, partial [Anaerolineae bacterium]
THLGFLFKGMPDYEGWLVTRRLSGGGLYSSDNLVDLNTVEPARDANGGIAIHLHIFYPDLAKKLAEYLKNMPFPYDLYISVTDKQVLEVCHRLFASSPRCHKIDIRLVPNRGRDIAPMFCTFGAELSRYDYVAHFHTKKSLYNRGATEGWGEYLYRNLLGNEERIRKIFGLMQGLPPYGIVYPQNFALLPYWANTWLANRELGRMWCARLGIYEIPRGYFDYPAGSMFWARGDALAPLFRAGIRLNDFPEESGQTDGTLSHTLERLFVLCSLKQGMRPAIIQDEEHPSWSAWRFDHYVNRPYQAIVAALNAPQVRLIIFDVFDTLLSRPLLNSESIKDVVARRIGGEVGSLYKQYRSVAEDMARREKGQDVGMDEIYTYLHRLTGLSETIIKEIRDIEEKVEEASVEPRWEVVRLFQDALGTGKPVVLATDMFLPRKAIERFLRKFGIVGWDELFVSSEIGMRKDNGRLYEYILSKYDLKPSQILVIGDDERSDTQIPCDMGASFIHILKPIELARGLPRFSSLIAHHERNDDLDAQITLGLVVRKNFAPITYPNFDPTSLVQATPYNWGYSLVGPLLVSFAQWLLEMAREDGVERLYFLAREGRLMKEVYDRWSQGIPEVPRSEYLVISRRAAGVAAISQFEDIVEIARTIYFPNTLESFLQTRYGLILSEEQWQEVEKATGWRRDSIVKVQNRKVEHLVPLLQILQSEILAHAERERQALLQYLKEKELTQDSRQAVVDIGYGGSVQGYLNRLLPLTVHGYYMMTDERAAKIAQTYGAIIRGCFCENVVMQSPNAPAMARYSFDVEKLMSVTEPQLECYEIDEMGMIRARYRALSPKEMESASIREEIRKGAMDYVEDAFQVRKTILHDFRPSCWTAQMLMEAFLTKRSDRESELLSEIALDDYYCGRGVVA